MAKSAKKNGYLSKHSYFKKNNVFKYSLVCSDFFLDLAHPFLVKTGVPLVCHDIVKSNNYISDYMNNLDVFLYS